MPDARVEFGEVHVSLTNGGGHAQRAGNISRLAFDHVRRMLDARRLPPRGAALDRLRAGPVHVALDAMDDDEVARATAAEIYRALLGRCEV